MAQRILDQVRERLRQKLLVAAVTGHAVAAAAPTLTENTGFDVKEAEKQQALWWYLLLAGLLLLSAETVVSNRLSRGERFL